MSQRPVENTVLDLVGHLADGDVCHAQPRLAFGRLLLDEVVGEVLAEFVESGRLSNIFRELEASITESYRSNGVLGHLIR